MREKLTCALEEAACQLEGALRATAEEAGKRLVDAPVRELLRAVGETVVREVLWLPRAAAAMSRWPRSMRSSSSSSSGRR